MWIPPKGSDEIFSIYQEYIKVDEVEKQLEKQPKTGSDDSHSDSKMEGNQKHKTSQWQKDHPSE